LSSRFCLEIIILLNEFENTVPLTFSVGDALTSFFKVKFHFGEFENAVPLLFSEGDA
jgi:hypothetical protein